MNTISESQISGLSIIICCHNSEQRLEPTINYLLKLKHDTFAIEFIFVDNASQDKTRSYIEQRFYNSAYSDSYRIVYEAQLGLSFARKKGIDESKYEYFVFCDDDNWLDENYTQICFNIFENNDSIALLGGQSFAVTETDPPSWFERVKNDYAIGIQSEITGEVTTSRGFVWGAGMAIRKSAYLQLKKDGFVSQLTDRIGTALVSGGDTELCIAFRLSGHKIYVDNNLKFFHYVPTARMKWSYFINLKISFAKADPVLFIMNTAFESMTEHDAEKLVKQHISFLVKRLFRFKKQMILRWFKDNTGNETDAELIYLANRLLAFIKMEKSIIKTVLNNPYIKIKEPNKNMYQFWLN